VTTKAEYVEKLKISMEAMEDDGIDFYEIRDIVLEIPEIKKVIKETLFNTFSANIGMDTNNFYLSLSSDDIEYAEKAVEDIMYKTLNNATLRDLIKVIKEA